MTTPQQQPEEPIGANLDQTGEETLNRLKQGAKYLTGSEEYSCNPNEAPQEQWMEEFDRKFRVTHGFGFYDGEKSVQLSDALKSFIKSQLEAAEKRATQNKKIEIQETLHDFANWLNRQDYMDSDWYTEEPNAVDRYLASLTNHN